MSLPQEQCNLRHRTAVIVTLPPGAISGARFPLPFHPSEEPSATLFPFQIIAVFRDSTIGVWVLSNFFHAGLGNRTSPKTMAGKSQLGCLSEREYCSKVVILDTLLP